MVRERVAKMVGCYIYCLYSTEDGLPRYVGRASDKVSYRFHQHIASALEKKSGALYDWMRDAWRRGFDVLPFTLQQQILPVDVEMFERYWMRQFTGLLNVTGYEAPVSDSEVAVQIKDALRQQLRMSEGD